MRRLSIPIKVLGAWLGMVAFLTISAPGQFNKSALETPNQMAPPRPEELPLCNGVTSSPSAGRASAQVRPHPHSVTLSWNAAVPASNAPRDAIKGYYVYRSLASHTFAESNRISVSPLRGTRCVDTNVEPKKTYFYRVTAITEGGTQSGSSIEIKAKVPSP